MLKKLLAAASFVCVVLAGIISLKLVLSGRFSEFGDSDAVSALATLGLALIALVQAKLPR